MPLLPEAAAERPPLCSVGGCRSAWKRARHAILPNAAAVLGGGGIKGGQVIGKTSAGGDTIAQRPVSVPDLLATVCRALGIDPKKSNLANVSRPISVVDKAGKPLEEVVASR